jgi:hypothetical protein
MCRIITSVVIILLIAAAGCKEPESTEPDSTASYISFLDKGAISPDATSILTIIDKDFIVTTCYQRGSIISSWTNRILSEEYGRLNSIIDNNNLIGAPDPTGEPKCIGIGALEIVIKRDAIIDTISIRGDLRCGDVSWPVGLDSLVWLKETYERKYGSSK